MEKECLFCKTGFTPKNPKGKFCSGKCRVYYGRGVKRTMEIVSSPALKTAIKKATTDMFVLGEAVIPDPKDVFKKQKEDYEQEMAALGETPLAKQRKRWLGNKIYEINQILR